MKEYVGDSVYAEWDGDTLTLTTENGYPEDPRNRIVLDCETWHTLMRFVDRLKKEYSGFAYYFGERK